MNLINDNPHSTLNELLYNSFLVFSYVRKIIDYLRERGLIQRVGSNKTGY